MENLRGNFICLPDCEQIWINNITEPLDESHTLGISKTFFDHEEKCSVVSTIINTERRMWWEERKLTLEEGGGGKIIFLKEVRSGCVIMDKEMFIKKVGRVKGSLGAKTRPNHPKEKQRCRTREQSWSWELLMRRPGKFMLWEKGWMIKGIDFILSA